MRALVLCSMLVLGCGTGEDSQQPLPPMQDSSPAAAGASSDLPGTVTTQDNGDGGTECVCIGEPGVAGPAGEPGADGASGLDGLDGADGSSCSVSQTATGALVSCTDGSSATLTNGQDGAVGPAGADGQSITGPMGPTGQAGPAGEGCYVSQTPTGATVVCGSTSAVLTNGVDGENGDSIVGPAGDPGPAGADGSFDPSTLYLRVDGTTISGPNSIQVSCDSGDIVLTGGCYFNAGSGLLGGSYPMASSGVSTDMPDSWRCEGNADSARLNARVVCLDLP